MQISRLNEQAKQLNLASITLSKSLRYGMFNSLFLGQGIEFDSCRDYDIGDDIRSIDWNLTARTGKAFVKLFHEEHDVTIFVLVDASSSMYSTGPSGISYFEKAIEVASLFLFAGMHLSCPVGGLLFDSGIQLWLPQSGPDFVFSLVHRMAMYQCTAKSCSNLPAALDTVERLINKKSLLVIISDFKIAGYEKKLNRLAKNSDIIAVNLCSQNDYKLADVGLLPLADYENNRTIYAPTHSQKYRESYKKNFIMKKNSWENSCIECGVIPYTLNLQSNTITELGNFLRTTKNKYEFINLFKRAAIK